MVPQGALPVKTGRAAPRLDPPALAIPAALQWALVRAFGPAEARWPAPPSDREALDLARRFDLAARIGGRHPIDALGRELGARTASAFALEHGLVRRAAAGLGELTALLASTAAGLGVPVVLLKFAALRAGGFVADGLRVAGDVDALVPAERAEALAEALARHGLVPAGFRDEPHQLATRRDAEGRRLDLHLHVPGLRVGEGEAPVTFAVLAAAGLLRRVGLPGECFVPSPAVLVAHALVHALAHHAPHTYPQIRLVGDLLDLGAAGDDGALARAAEPFVGNELTPAEMAAAVALARRLGSADASLFEAGEGASPEGLLLRHLVAGVLDDDYRHALRLQGLRARVGRARGPRELVTALARYVWRALFITDAQVEVLYGRPRSRLGYLGRRLARPFDLAARAARIVAGGLRLRRRR
jgi:hypothetical protein